AEHTLDRHNGWMRQEQPQGLRPSELFRERILCCFIDDRVGLKLLDEFNVDNVCWESDYPHSDSSWPAAPERLEVLLAGLEPDVIDKITHGNAMRHYQFDPFAIRPRERCTVGALRAEAGDVDTVTHVGRRADERDLATWKKMTGAAARAPK
ncbi:MAG: amidohydrolase family protein, partial [Acidimicrobiia bacterium]